MNAKNNSCVQICKLSFQQNCRPLHETKLRSQNRKKKKKTARNKKWFFFSSPQLMRNNEWNFVWQKLNATMSKRPRIKLGSEKIPTQSPKFLLQMSENTLKIKQYFWNCFWFFDLLAHRHNLIATLINWKQQISTTIPSAVHAVTKNKKKWHFFLSSVKFFVDPGHGDSREKASLF